MANYPKRHYEMNKQIILLTFCAFLFSGCEKKVSQEEFDSMQADLQNQITELESQVESKQTYIQEMNTSIQNLSGDVDRFDYEDWRDVVPDVYQQAKDLENNIQQEP